MKNQIVFWGTALLCLLAVLSNNAFGDLNEGLIARWSFDNAVDPGHDDASSGLNGTVYGATPTTERWGNALSFNGSSDYVDIINTDNLNMTSGFTLSSWAKFTEYNQDTEIVGKHISGVIAGYLLGVRDNKFCFYLNNRYNTGLPNEYPDRLETQEVYNDGQWHHVVGVYDGVAQSLFVDGILKEQQVIPYTSFSSATVHIGAFVEGQYYGAFDGLIDEVSIYNRALTGAEVVELYTVPEPATLFLLTLGGMFLRRRKV